MEDCILYDNFMAQEKVDPIFQKTNRIESYAKGNS